MSLQVGGAVLGVAVLTVINNSVVSMNGGQSSANARRKGYDAAYYGAIALSGLAALLSFFTAKKAAPSKTDRSPEESTEQSRKGEKEKEKPNKSNNNEDERATSLESC